MAIIPFEIDTSKSVDPLNDLADQMEKVVDATEDVQKAFKNTFSKAGDEVDKTTKEINEQLKAENKVENEAKKIREEFVKTEKAKKKAFDDKEVDEYAKSVGKAEAETEDLNDDLDKTGKKGTTVFGKLGDGIKDIASSFGNLGNVVTDPQGGVQGGLTGILGKIGPVGIGIAAVGAGLGVVANEVLQVDKHFDELRGTVQLLFKGTEEETDRIVVNVEAIAKTFGVDVKEAITAANTVAKEFGISGEDATKVLADGLNSAANINGNFLEDLKEFSPQIRAAGGDVEDLVNILRISGEEGIFSNKGIDAVKEAGIRLREQSQSTKDALTNAFGADFAKEIFDGISSGALTSVDAVAEISERMGGLRENSKATQELISGVFGGQGEDAGFRFLTLLKDINDETAAGNAQLTEEQQRKQETFEANQRLASAQNKLSKAIGDSSAVGRIWIDIQVFFVELLVDIVDGINAVVKAFESWENFAQFMFELLIPGLELYNENLEGLNASQRDHVFVVGQATEAIRKWGAEAKARIGVMQDEFSILESSTATEEQKTAAIEKLNKAYPEIIGNIDLERASTEELNKIKEEITRTIIEEEIARKQLNAQRLLDIEIQNREAELARTARGSQRAKDLLAEIEFLQTRGQERLNNLVEETRIQLGLEERKNDEIVEDAELTEEELKQIGADAAKDRQKAVDDFNKAIEEILKRGQAAFLNDQIVSEEERLDRQKKFQIQELENLLDHAEDLQEQLTGSRQLDANVIEAFNRAQEAIEVDFQDKILKIRRDAADKARAEQLKIDQDVLKEKESSHATELALIDALQRQELATIQQTTEETGRKAAEFERKKQIETLDIQAFYLAKKIELIDEELALKKEALGQELEAIEGKEGAEFDLRREGIDQRAALLEQESASQKLESDNQLQNIEAQISALENIKGPTLGEVFGDIQSELAKALDLDPQQLQAIVGAIQQVTQQIFQQIQQAVAAQIEANDAVIDQLKEREQEVKDSIDREVEFAKLGYAANVAAKRGELADVQEAEQQAHARRTELLKQQEFLDTASQTVSLVTAAANLYKSLSSLPFGIGIAIATALSAAMFAAFVASKAKAQSITSLEKGGYGDEFGVITGKRHYQGGERMGDHVEVEAGESYGVFNRRATRKNRALIRAFTESMNQGIMPKFVIDETIPDKLVQKTNDVREKEIILKAQFMSGDLQKYVSVLPDIKDAMIGEFGKPKQLTYVDAEGNTYLLELHKNGSRKRTKMRK